MTEILATDGWATSRVIGPESEILDILAELDRTTRELARLELWFERQDPGPDS